MRLKARPVWMRAISAILSVISSLHDLGVRFYWKIRLGSLGEKTRIYSTVKIYRPSRVHIGQNSVLNDYIHIWGNGGVHIGSNTLIASHTVITSQAHDIDAVATGKLYRETNQEEPIEIGNNVWIGSNAVILPGVRIGNDSVVGAGAVVTKDVPRGVLVMGVPAKIVRALI